MKLDITDEEAAVIAYALGRSPWKQGFGGRDISIGIVNKITRARHESGAPPISLMYDVGGADTAPLPPTRVPPRRHPPKRRK